MYKIDNALNSKLYSLHLKNICKSNKCIEFIIA